VEPILVFAEELERRDADVARRLDAVEARQHAVEEVRQAIAEAAAQLQRLPALRKAQELDEAAAFEARTRAVTAVREAEEHVSGARESDRPSAERRLDDARARLQAVEREIEHVERRREALREDERGALEQVASAASLAASLGADADAAGPPGEVISLVAEWAARERGALILEHSNLVGERDVVVREASELLASTLGEPSALTSVAGLRARLERS
jgi:chromosome segregation ATPase